MDKISVRRARREDSGEFLRLLVELANFEHLEPPNAAAKSRIVRDIFQKKKTNLLLAFATEGTRKERKISRFAVGYALYFYTYSSFLALPTLYLEDLFVSEKYRGKRIGHELFMSCVEKASGKGCGRMEWSVLTWNKNAISFYEKLGAKRLEEWYYYRLDSRALASLATREKARDKQS